MVKNTLIIPAAGDSTRFSCTKPKWLLSNPNGRLLIEDCIMGLNLNDVDLILIGVLKKHIDKYCCGDAQFLAELEYKKINVAVVVLHEKTSSQSETVYKMINKFHDKQKKLIINGSIFIKDCDNYFKHTVISNKNYVCYVDLNDNKNITNIVGKSFIEYNNLSEITNIVEKKVISENISVGGYAFANVDDFIKTFEKIRDSDYYEKLNELYISHIIYDMTINDTLFFAEKVTNYHDWGTYEDWIKYKSKFKTLFIDLDGTLVTNTNAYYGENITSNCKPIIENVEKLQKLYETSTYYIIITTARLDSLEDITKKQLNDFKIPYDKLLIGIPHSQRILVNDYSLTNPYPSAVSINLERNSNKLSELL